MKFIKQYLFVFLILHLFLYAETNSSSEVCTPKASAIEFHTAPLSPTQNDNNSIQAFWKILTPFLLLGLLLLISHYVLRQYNKRLKEQVERNIEELRKKDELLL